MPHLLDVQRRFRSAVLADASPPIEIIGGRVNAAARLAIYRNNVIGNLTRALRLSYPAVERLVGADFFAVAAQRFIVASPPGSADLNQYGAGFADFLMSFEAAASVSYLADVARLEWAVSRALHAAAASSLTPDALREVPAERQADLCFRAHPSLSLVVVNYPARAIWEAVLTADAEERSDRLAAVDIGAGGEALAVLRGDGGLDLVGLSDAVFAFAGMLTSGRPLGEALEDTAPDDAACWLADFLARGFFADFSLHPEDALPQHGTMS